MKRRASLALALVALAAGFAGSGPAIAQSITYAFTGLPGNVSDCAWFDDNINDRSLDSLIRQTDQLYNRVALPPGQAVAISGTGTTAKGEQLVQFDLGRRLICTGADAVYPPTPSPQPTSSATPQP
jgi:hypothetical protein